MTVECLTLAPRSARGEGMYRALRDTATAAGVVVRSTTCYVGRDDVLMVWGPGHPSRVEPMQRHLAQGGHVLAWDLAYWAREQKVRVSIDAPHPQAWVMRHTWPASRYLDDHVTVEEAWDPHGPVIVAGIGHKAKVQYGAAVVEQWEAACIARCQARGQRVCYRPKRPTDATPAQVDIRSGPLETVLRGASLLITWHSNVAVDAIRTGLPVVCRDGAAAAVCGQDIATAQPLTPECRTRFLHNLAWFQWAPHEATQCWAWVQAVLA